MGIDADDVKVVINAGLHCIKTACSQYARNHPFISGVLLLFLFLYIFFPSLFNLLFYSSPFLIGLALYFGAEQLGFSHRSIKNEDEKTHGASLPKDHIRKEDIKVSHLSIKNEDEKPHGASLPKDHIRKEDIKDHGTSVASQVHQGEKEDAENHGTSVQNNKSITRSGSNNWQRVRKPILAEMSRRTFKRKDKTAYLKEDEIESQAPSFRDEFFGSLLNEMSMKLKEEESRVSGSNLVEEGSSSNVVDAGEVKKSDVVDAGKLLQKHDCEDEVQNLKPLIPYVSASASDSEDEEETQEERNKAVAWTEDDQRNLMDLGTSEIERNRRLESLIAKRRARKLLSIQPHRNLLDSDHSVMSPILTSRAVDDADCQPGSAPSVLLPSRNPFDLPYDPSEEKPVLTGGSFEEEFFSTHHKDICMCRHESFHRGPSYVGQLNEETVAKSHPGFLTKPRTSSEGPGYSRFRRESDAEDNMSQICDELEREALYNGDKSDSQVLRRPSFPIGSAAKNAEVLEDGKQDKAKDDVQITMEEKENAVNKDCRKETRVRPRMVEDDSSNEWSSSSSSAVTENVFIASKNEAFRNSVRKVLTCLVRKDQGTRKQIIDPAVDSPYDSSPTGFQPSKIEERSYYTRRPFHTPSYSIASDMNVEVSEAGSPTNNMETNSPPTDTESLVYDGDVDKDINSGDEEFWGASPHPIASDEFASRFRINETGEFNRSPLGIPYSSSSTIDFSRQIKKQPSVDSGFPPTPRVVFSDGRKSRVTGFDHQMDDENQQVITDDAVESRSSVSSSSDVVHQTLEHTRPDLETSPVCGIGPDTAEHHDSSDAQESWGESQMPNREEDTASVASNLVGENYKLDTVNGLIHDDDVCYGFRVENDGDIQSSYNTVPPPMLMEPSDDQAHKSILPETEATFANCKQNINNDIEYSLGSVLGKGSLDNQQQQNGEQSGDNMTKEEKQSEATVTHPSGNNYTEATQRAAVEVDSCVRKSLSQEEEKKDIKLVDNDVSNLIFSNGQECSADISSLKGGNRNTLDNMGSQDKLEYASDNSTTKQVLGNFVLSYGVQGQQLISQVAKSMATNSFHDSIPPAMVTEIVVEQVPFGQTSSPKFVVHDTIPMDGITSTKNDQNNQKDSSLMLVSEGQADDKTKGRSKEEMESKARLQPSHTVEENKDIMDILVKSISSEEVATEANSNMQGQSLVDEEAQEVKTIEGNCHDLHCSTSQQFDANLSRSLEVAHLVSDVESKAQQDSKPKKATVIANSVMRDPLAPVEEGKENESTRRMVSNSIGSTSKEIIANLSSLVDETNTEVGKETEVSNSLTDINDATTHEESKSLKKATVEANIDKRGPTLIHEHMAEEYKSIEDGMNDPNSLMNQGDVRLIEEAQASPNGDINTNAQLWPSNSTLENNDFRENEASKSSEKGVTGARDTTHGMNGNDFRRENR